MTIRIGIIGTGSIADGGHAPAIEALTNAKLVAVLSRDKTRGRDFVRRHNSPEAKIHTSLEEFSSDENIDLAIVCSPDRLHYEHVIACLQSGKHVLVEKPMTTSLDDALKIKKMVSEKNLSLAVSFHLRSHHGHRILRNKIKEDKAIGDIRHIRVIWAFPNKDDSNWRTSKALGKWWSLAAVGAHCIDLARWFSDDMDDWASFSSIINNKIWNGPHDETAVIAAELSSGITVEIVSTVQFGPYTRIELFGRQGQAFCENTLGRNGAGSIIINNESVDFLAESPFIGQLKNIIDNIENSVELRSNVDTGVRSVKDLLLAHDSPDQ